MSGELPLTPEDVAEIVAILDGSGYANFEIRTARFGLKIARSGDGWTQEWDHAAAASEPAAATPVASPAPTSPKANEPGEAQEGQADEGVAVLPPLPGTFYRAPQPGAPAFVEIGDMVGPETVVGIVETMKLMNPVHAGASGRVAAILVDNATLIDADAVLMRIVPEPA
jgi:acetyl-CoA carboxylase biotin carboxyl carrier protein